MENQLIILGNGFDLAAGLNSRYQDFLEKVLEDDSKLQLNYWKNLFAGLYKIESINEWSQIERVISDVLHDILKHQHFYVGKNSNLDANRRFIGEDRLVFYDALINSHLFEKYDDLNIFLLDIKKHLYYLEREFCRYLKNEIKNNVDYENNAKNNISKLIKDDASGSLLMTKVISFNYTTPFGVNDKTNNIHGSLEKNNIIFGINSVKDEKGEDDIFIFSKNYRVMENENEFFRIENQLNYLKFFGHGLDQADYSYFQTIFDTIDILNGETKIIFYYSIYNKEKETEIKRKYVNSIYSLLRNYEKDRNISSINLVNKLLLEGRLKIKEINL